MEILIYKAQCYAYVKKVVCDAVSVKVKTQVLIFSIAVNRGSCLVSKSIQSDPSELRKSNQVHLRMKYW